MRLLFTFLVGLTLIFSACQKDEDLTLDSNAKLSLSTDSVLFDTVFTAVGSTNRRIKIFNRNTKALNISQIKLSGLANSPFSININGQALTEKINLKLKGKDSINIFVKITINPNNQNLPFIVQDSILILCNGNKQKINLVAYGQNAIYINNASINSNTVWDSKLPYIITKAVTVEEDKTLTLQKGTKILFHSNATMNIKGTLLANGTKTDSIIFASDRLEQIYKEEPGQWNGLHFFANSKNSIINYAIIKNGIAAITADSLSKNTNPKLILSNTIIKNMAVVGFLGYHTQLAAFNNLFFNCGQYLIYGVGGGNYNLKQNTFAAYNYTFPRRTPAVYLSDFISSTEFANLQAEVTNNIIWGSLTEEFLIEKKSSATVTSNVRNNLIKSIKADFVGNGNIFNSDPKFISPQLGLFLFDNTSPAANKGLNLALDPYFDVYLKKDLKNKVRIFPSSLGCYENN